jgi:DNA-directed RNA polymerase specialized sigma24 family protein
MVRLIDRLALKDQDWKRIVRSFGASKEASHDIVQNMYLKLDQWERDHTKKSILYNDREVNYYFVFKVLRTLFLDYIKSNGKYIKPDSDKCFNKSNDYELSMNDLTDELKEKLRRMHWYDQRIFKIVCLQGVSMLQLSELTGISYYSIKRTIKKVKTNLK